MQHVDTLIYAGWIIPVEPENIVYEQHAIAIQEGKIIALLPSDEAVSRYSARITHRLSTHVLIPGLINTHTHAAMSLLRGIANDLPLYEWLNTRIWPIEQACMGREFVAHGTQLAIAEMLRSGVTCFNDMYFFPDVTAEVVEKSGIRAAIGLILLDFPTVWAKDANEYLKKAQTVHEQVESHSLITTTLAPHAPYTVSDMPLIQGRELAEKLNIAIHMHVHETVEEIQGSIKQYGKRPLARLNKLGLLSPRLMGIHLTQLQPDEIELLAKKGVNAVYCPESNMKLASGFCPVHELLSHGINVALGTDGCASNDDLDILGEMHIAALLAKGLSQDARTLTAAQALQMATLNGAKALGIDRITGSLIPGKAADITAIDLNELETQPVYNPLSQLIYSVNRDKVTDVWVAGKHLLKSRALTSLDVHDIKAKTHAWRTKIINIVEKLNITSISPKNKETDSIYDTIEDNAQE